jgi:hypothetical protein
MSTPGETSPEPQPLNRLTKRQEEVYEFYSKAKANIFGPNDYSMIAPCPKRSLFISDETMCVAKAFFGAKFDNRVRRFAVDFALISLLTQVVALPIGLWVLANKEAPNWVFIVTSTGGVFPLILLLRSHYAIARHLCMQWEPVFLTFYSFIFCLGVTYLRKFNFSVFFVFGAIFPALLASAFADAGAIRLDYAFIKGDISLLALALPPYMAAIGSIIVILIFVTFGGGKSIGEADNPNSNDLTVRAQSLVQSTGFTILLFLVRSMVLLIIEPRRCVSVHAPMINSIVTLSPDTTRSTEIAPQGYKNYYVNCVLSAKIIRPEDEDEDIGGPSGNYVSPSADNRNNNGNSSVPGADSTIRQTTKSSTGRRTAGFMMDVETTHNVIASYTPNEDGGSTV